MQRFKHNPGTQHLPVLFPDHMCRSAALLPLSWVMSAVHQLSKAQHFGTALIILCEVP